MYSYAIIAICVTCAIYIFLKERNIINPLFVFNIIWAVIIFLDSLHLYGLCVAENRIYLYILLGIIAFDFGYICWSIFRQRHKLIFSKKKFKRKNNYIFEPRYRLLYFLGLICIIYFLKTAVIAIGMILNGNGLDAIRMLAQDPESVLNTRTKFENAIRVIMILPVATALEAISAIDFWAGKRDKLLLIISVTIILLRSVTDGGRSPMLNFFMYMIVGFILTSANGKNRNHVRNNKKRRRTIILVTLVGMICLYLFSKSRAGGAALKNLYLYFSMEPYMFNQWANTADSFKLIGYSEASLNGFSFAILYVIKNIFNIDFPQHWNQIYQMIRNTDSQWQVITQISTRANAYVTTFWFFYLDGRLLGILLGMFTYGVYVAHTFVEAVKKANQKSICIFGLILQGLFFTFIRFPFSNIYYALAYIFIIFIAYKPKR